MGAIPQVPDRPSEPLDNVLYTCDHCSFQGFRDEGDFIDIHNLTICSECYKVYHLTCTSCDQLFHQEKDLCRVDDLVCKACCENACGGDCNHIPEEVKLDN